MPLQLKPNDAAKLLISFGEARFSGSGLSNPGGMTIGSIAVDIFFVTSGFLVTASLLVRQSIVEFFYARVLRIFPALLVMLILTVFFLGASVTRLPLTEYFSGYTTYIYLLKCSTLITGVKYNLPGVFDFNPYRYAVNGSLWTMPHEVRMYALLATTWAGLSMLTQTDRQNAFRRIIPCSAIVSLGILLINHYSLSDNGNFVRLFFMFFTGSAFFILKERILLSWPGFLFALALLAISASIDKEIFFAAYIASIAYVVFFIAYVPTGLIRKYNQLGDYSYGVYIYAFPIQQTIAFIIDDVSVFTMIWMSVTVTLVFAVASWHLLETRALGYRRLCVELTKRKFWH